MKQIFQKVTQQLIDQLKAIDAGEIDATWFRPWGTSGAPQFPTNQLTGMEYKGMNAFLLHMMALGEGYRTNRWVTFKQKDKFNEAHDASMKIRKGEHGYPIFKYVEWTPKDAPIVNGEARKAVALRQYTVFNIDQMENIPEGYEPAVGEPSEDDLDVRWTAAEIVASKLKTPMEHSEIDRAYYSPSKHIIRMPKASTFKSIDHYYATLFHEHVHSTGKELERDMTGTMGTESYAKEELIAEIGSALMCAHYGITAPVQHPQYIKGYIKQLQDSDRAFWTAASQAQKAVNCLIEQVVTHD